MRRGEVWLVSFARSPGGHVRTPQPAVIVSNNDANHIQVVPLSSKTRNVSPSEARVTVGGKKSKAMADQIITVRKHQLTERLGALCPHEMQGVDMALRIQLGLAA
jgi:mRNA interferase MazF